MSGLYYTNPYSNPYLSSWDVQYGVNTQSPTNNSMSGFGAASSLMGAVPYIGPFLSLAMNMAGTAYQNSKQEEFYNMYSSPAARMRQMMSAGINPAAAAQGISGAAPAQMNAASPTGAFSSVGEQLGQSVNTALTADAIRADVRNTEADTRLKDTESWYNLASFDERLGYARNLNLISGEEYSQARELTRRYPEILENSIEEVRSKIESNRAQSDFYRQQVDNLKKQISEIEERIRLMRTEETANLAIAGENNARAQLELEESLLTQKKTELAQIEKSMAELGADDNVILHYRQIESEQGRDAADAWLEGQYRVANRLQEAIENANPITAEQRRIISSYSAQIALAEKDLRRIEELYYNSSDLRRSWYSGDLDAARSNLENLRHSMAEQLRRLGSNTSEHVSVFGIGGSRSR